MTLEAWLWICAHITAAPLFYFRSGNNSFSLIILALMIPVYLSGNFIGDIKNSYIYGINNPMEAQYDIGFVWLINILNNLGFYAENLMYIIQGICGLFVCTSIAIWRDKRMPFLFLILYTLMTIYFFFETQNVIKQGYSNAATIIAMYFF